MPLEVRAGLPGECAARELETVACDAAAAGRSVLVAVPRDADAIRMRARLSSCAPVGVRVATLEGVLEAEWALTGDGRRLARGLGRSALLSRALISAGVSDRPGRGAVAVLGTLAERSPTPVGKVRSTAGLAGRLMEALASYDASLAEHGMVEGSEACAKLAATGPPVEIVIVDGFVRLPREFEALLTGWADLGAEVSIYVPWRPDCPGTAASGPLVERLCCAGATLSHGAASTGECPPELERVRRELFTSSPPGEGTGAVSLAVVQGEEAEARHIARAVSRVLADGALPDSIVIAFAEPSRHEAWIRRALADASVPADFEVARSVGETAFGQALLTLNACVSNGAERAELSALVRSPFSGVPMPEADAADAAWRRGGARRGRTLLKRTVPLARLIDAGMALRGAPVGSTEAQGWKKLADQLLANGHPGAAPVPGEDGRTDAAVHRLFCRLLGEAVELGEGEISADELWQHFADSRVTPSGLRRPGRVLVTSVDAVPAEERAHVILGGLTASEFPRRGSEDRLEGDSVSLVMSRLGIPLDPEEHARDERRAFFLAAVSATGSLTLVRRGSDDEGAPLRESIFWDEFLDLYRRPGEGLPAGAPTIETGESDPPEGPGGKRAARGELHGDDALADLSSIAAVSPSEVEAYLACPYRWFVGRRLRAEAPDRAVDVAGAGRIAHDALARFYREWRARGFDRVTRDSRDAASVCAREAVGAAMSDAGPAESLEEITLLGSIGPMVVALIERDADFLPGYVPEHVEWAFGGKGAVPAVDLGGVSIVGRADRIDVGPEGLVIVDYKRTHASSLARIRAEGLVQLQLYGAAASRALGLPLAGGLYRSLKDGSARGFVLGGVPGSFSRADVVERDELDSLVAEAVEATGRAVEGMRAGAIEPSPSAEACRYCQAASFCGRAVSA